jgi:hypothetical protein
VFVLEEKDICTCDFPRVNIPIELREIDGRVGLLCDYCNKPIKIMSSRQAYVLNRLLLSKKSGESINESLKKMDIDWENDIPTLESIVNDFEHLGIAEINEIDKNIGGTNNGN